MGKLSTMTQTRSDDEDHYAVLGVSDDATISEITAAFYALARRFHPDTTDQSDPANKRFKRIVEAFESLTRGSRGGVHRRAPVSRPRSGQADANRFGRRVLETDLPVSPEEIRRGGRCELKVSRTIHCPDCRNAAGHEGDCQRCQSSGTETRHEWIAIDLPRSIRPGTVLTVRYAGGLIRLRVVVRPSW
jgi:DnaJ-class molecular chaperone